MSKGFASTYRIALLGIALLLCFGAIGVRLVFVHLIEREQLLASLQQVHRLMRVEHGRRGDILDRNGAKLATSVSAIELGVDPMSLQPKDEKNWPKLAALLDIPEPELRRIFTTKYRPAAPEKAAAKTHAISSTSDADENAGFTLNLNLDRPIAFSDAPAATDDSADGDDTELDAADNRGLRPIRWASLCEVSESINLAVENLKIAGVYGRRVYRRAYPNRQLASHLIGFVNRDQIPAAGIEAYADLYLRGVDGWSVGEKDGRQREIARFRSRDVPAADGYSVQLSIDSAVQDLVEQELAGIAQKYQPLKATIIVSDPRTGFILGLGNHPTFDPNEYNKVPRDEQERMRNVAVADIYEPGSVFKIVAVAAGLEERLIRPEDTFDTATPTIDYPVGSKVYTLKLPPEDHHFENPAAVSVRHIVSFSSNRGAARIAMKVGDEKFRRYAVAFGFGQKLGFPVGGEVPGILHSVDYWRKSPLDFTRVPMGHALAVTPLQMHQAMSVIAAHGVLLRPQIIKEIRDADNQPVFRYGREEIGRAISPDTARTMAALLQGVASKEGTAPEAAIAGYEVAGKTGTAQKYIEGKPSDRHHVVSFVGFFPASRPQVVISVIVDDADARCPLGIAYGAKVAAPVFKDLGEKLIPILDIKAPGSAAGADAFAMNGGLR